MKKVLFIHPGNWSFVESDIITLGKKYRLSVFYYHPGKSIFKNLLMQIKMLFWLLINIWTADALYIWFADYHSFLPVFFSKLFFRRSFLVLGGYDVTYIPQLKYGAFSNPLRSFFAGYSIKKSSYLLPVDESLTQMALKRTGEISGEIVTLPTGYDPKDWYCDTQKEDMVLTVANIKDHQTFLRKGIDFYIEVAKKMPQYKFVLIGLHESIIIDEIPSNLEIAKKMDRPMLRSYYSRAKVYAQFSIHEGLPNVLCEAMLCECIPVGTNICGIPTGIGDTGYVVNSVEEAISAIVMSMQSDQSGKNARKRIIDHFNLSKRRESLYKLIG